MAARAAGTAAIGRGTATTIEAALTFGRSSDTGRAVDVREPGRGAGHVDLRQRLADEDHGAFLDQGERNYGLWEYSYYGSGGALDNRGADNHPLLGLSGPPVGSGDPSGRAPFYVTSRK